MASKGRGALVSAGPNSTHRSILSRQPLQSLAHLSFLIHVLFVQLPIRTVVYILLPRLTRPHPQWPLARSLLVTCFGIYRKSIRSLGIVSGTVSKSVLPRLRAGSPATPVWLPPIDASKTLKGDIKDWFDAAHCSTQRIPGFWYGRDHQAKTGVRRARAGEKVFLFFHGGGYIEQSAHPSGPIAALPFLLLRAADKSPNPRSPKRLLATEYRLTSDGAVFPAILADALASWIYLVRDCSFKPQDIAIVGDSAGGNLALALTRYIRDFRPLSEEGLLPADSPIADSLLLFSPWVDLSLSHAFASPSSSYKTNANYEFLTMETCLSARNRLVIGLPPDLLRSRWMSAVCVDRKVEEDLFDNFPRCIVVSGALELFHDEISALVRQYQGASRAGRSGQIEHVVEPLAAHDFTVVPFIYTEENKRMENRLTRWL